MKHVYHITARNHLGRTVNATARARRLTSAVRQVLEYTKTPFSSIRSIRRES